MSFKVVHLPEIYGTISIHEAAEFCTLPMLEYTLIHCAKLLFREHQASATMKVIVPELSLILDCASGS